MLVDPRSGRGGAVARARACGWSSGLAEASAGHTTPRTEAGLPNRSPRARSPENLGAYWTRTPVGGRCLPDVAGHVRALPADRTGALTCGFNPEDQRVAGVGFEPT